MPLPSARRTQGQDQEEEIDLEQVSIERVGQMGKALGLHPEFVADVQARGQAAVIDRALLTDMTGALPRLLSMVQTFALWLEDETTMGEPPNTGAMQEAMAAIAESHDVDADSGVTLLGAVFELYGRAAESLARKERGIGNATKSKSRPNQPTA